MSRDKDSVDTPVTDVSGENWYLCPVCREKKTLRKNEPCASCLVRMYEEAEAERAAKDASDCP